MWYSTVIFNVHVDKPGWCLLRQPIRKKDYCHFPSHMQVEKTEQYTGNVTSDGKNLWTIYNEYDVIQVACAVFI